ELAQLSRAEQAVRDRNAQHGRMALNIEAIAQANRLELIFRQLAREKAPRLIPEFGYALIYEGLIELIVLIHGHGLYAAPARRPKYPLVVWSAPLVMSRLQSKDTLEASAGTDWD